MNQQTLQQQLDGIQPLPQAALTEEAIHKAADELLAAGKNPTHTAVRTHLGGGSFSTIGEAMKTWHAARKEQAARAAIVRLPEELEGKVDGLRQVLESAWTLALRHADDRLSKERAALEQVRVETEARAVELQEAVEQLEVEHAATAQVVVEREQLLQERDGEIRQLQERVAGLTGELHLRELAEQRAADATAHSQHLTAQLQREQQQVERLQAKLDELQLAGQQQAQELQEVRQAAALAEQAQQQQAQLLDGVQQELQVLREKHAEQAESLQESRRTTDVAEQVREQAQQLADRLQAEAKELQVELRQALQEAAGLKATVEALQNLQKKKEVKP